MMSVDFSYCSIISKRNTSVIFVAYLLLPYYAVKNEV